jgi:predicted aspartyl protease
MKPQQGKRYKALFDTGATHSSITPQVVADFSLPSIRAMKVGVGGGDLDTTCHLVNIALPNKVMFQMMPVAKMVLRDIDALIGMDILGIGDFAVTHHGNRTTFSFCCPSRREIDFVDEVQASRVVSSIAASATPAPRRTQGRNEPCLCGSGKKFKKCHGLLV